MTSPATGTSDRAGLPAQIRACLFDLDGVLTDTASVHRTAWKRAFDPVLAAHDQPPFTVDDYAAYVDGKPRRDGVRDFLASRGLHPPETAPADDVDALSIESVSEAKNAMLLATLEADGVEVFPGSVAYLEAIRSAGLPAAVVTASANGAAVLQAAGLEHFVAARIDGVVAAREELAGKPAPDTFLAGARALGVDPAQAAVFEDARAGVAAGRAGGFGWVVGVDRLGQADELREAGADVVVGDLAELLGTP
jgi:beta-phosphoglucomutase family hydrolase